jgi:hypothetical protein
MLDRVKSYLKFSSSKMTKDRYLEMCDQLGKEPVESEIPIGWEDLPDIAIVAINTFNMMSDRIAADIGFMGKDFTNLPHHIEIHEIHDKESFLEILHLLESSAIERSNEQMKRAQDKAKRKA